MLNSGRLKAVIQNWEISLQSSNIIEYKPQFATLSNLIFYINH